MFSWPLVASSTVMNTISRSARMANGLMVMNFLGPLAHMPLPQRQNEVALLIKPNIAILMLSIWILHLVTVSWLVSSDTQLSWLTETHATIGHFSSRTFSLTVSFRPFAAFMLWRVNWHIAFIWILIWNSLVPWWANISWQVFKGCLGSG